MRKTTPTGVRQSNMELLRIVSMFLVLVVHADFLALGTPTPADIATAPESSFFGLFFESLSIVCVNLFILISGYFSIRWKAKGFGNLLFQCLFYIGGIYLLLPFLPAQGLGLMDVVHSVKNLWFVWAYIGLYVIAPMLNAFVETTSQKKLGRFILIYYAFQFVSGWLLGASLEFLNGYSIVSFVGLYLIGRYVKLYSLPLLKMRKSADMAVYMALVLASTTLLFTMGAFSGGPAIFGIGRFYTYNAPNVVLASVALFVFFTKLKFQSRWVNWVGVSAFAVYLIHSHQLISPHYVEFIRFLRAEFTPPLLFGVVTFVALCAIFMACILVDKIRIFLWDRLWSCCEKTQGSNL